MTQWHIRFHRLALKEHLHEMRWYARRLERAAERFLAAIDAALKRIADNPRQFPQFHDDIRWVRLLRFQHVLYFHELDETTIEILAVAHAKRRLGYWLRRLFRR